jgi:hypothetical protein
LATLASIIDRDSQCDHYDDIALDLVAEERKGCQQVFDYCRWISAIGLSVLFFLRPMTYAPF